MKKYLTAFLFMFCGILIPQSNIEAAFLTDLSLGSTGEDVRALQQFLNSAGYIITAPGEETTYFGALTKNAVIAYQNDHAAEILAPLGFSEGTGNVSARTRTHINNALSVPDVKPLTALSTVDANSVVITVNVTGSGTVLVGENTCNTTSCAYVVPKKSKVKLTATPLQGASFTGWTGDCTGTATTCQLTAAKSRVVSATFGAVEVVTTPDPTPVEPTPTDPVVVDTAPIDSPTNNTLYVDASLSQSCTSGTYSIAQRNCSGTDAKAFKTIKEAVAVLTADTTIVVRGGTYLESVTLPQTIAATPDTPVIIKAYGGERPLLSGLTKVSSWTPCTSALCGQNAQWSQLHYAKISASQIPDLNNFRLYVGSEKMPVAQYPNQSNPWQENEREFKSVDTTSYGLTDGFISSALSQGDNYWNGTAVRFWSHGANNNLLNKKVASFSGGKVVFDVPLAQAVTSGTQPDGYSFVNSLKTEVLDTPGEYVLSATPDSNNMYTLYFWPKDSAQLTNTSFVGKAVGFLWAMDNLTIDGLEIAYFGGVGTRDGGIVLPYRSTPFKNIVLKNLIVHDVGGAGGIAVTNGNSVTIDNNKVYNTLSNTRGISVSGASILVSNNEVYKTNRTGIYFAGVTDGVMLNNYVHGYMGTHGNALTVYQNSNRVLLKGNRVFNTESVQITLQNSKDITVLGNVLQGADKSTYLVADWGGTTGYVRFLSNTLVGSSNNASLVLPSTKTATYSIKNNILDGGPSVTDQSNNLWVGLLWNQSSRYNWAPKTGELIENDLTKVFTDPTGTSLTLKQGSPAINTGTSIASYVESPLLGVSYSLTANGTPDMGAREY